MGAIHKVLVANRGEIALRVMRTCRAMGIATAAVYSDADSDAPFVRFADEAIRIGPPPARESYLVIHAILDAARATGAAILAIPVPDTVKRVSDGRIVETIPRGDLWLAQTPQAFAVDVLRRAHAAAPDGMATDDAALVERLGLPVAIVPGDATNRKITTREDLAWAEAVLAGSV